MLIAGTTLGAGMLAMPLATAKAGFGLTAVGLVALWFVAYYTALMFLEVYRYHSPEEGLTSLAGQAYGKLARLVIAGTLMVYMYSLMAAYTSEGGNLVGRLIGTSNPLGLLIYTLLFGFILKRGVSTVDGVNRLLFPVQMLVFGGLLALLLPRVTGANLSAAPQEWGLALAILPVFMTSYSFHVVLPSIAEYLDNDPKELRRAVLWGTGIPMLAYLIWQAAIHGVVPQETLSNVTSLQQLSQIINETTGNSLLGTGIDVFAGLALTTSFLGIGLSLTDSLRDSFPAIARRGERRGWPIMLLTLVPPALVALVAPGAFVTLLSYSGIMAVVYSMLLPLALVLHARRQGHEINLPGGPVVFWLIGVLAAVLLLVPLLVSVGVVPKVAG